MTEYIAAGGNRHPAAADWHENVLAYGTDRNIALWNPQGSRGVTTLLGGHTETVNAVKFLPTPTGLFLISGSVDKTVRVWRSMNAADGVKFECVQVLEEHASSVNCIAIIDQGAIFATGAADATVKIWKLNANDSDGKYVDLIQSIAIKPRFFPLALALSPLSDSQDAYVLVVAGTTTIVQLYISDSPETNFKLKATLSGHEGWIRSLGFTYETTSSSSDLLLASASQDKYIRLWRIHQGKELPAVAASGNDPALGAFLPGKSLSNKAHRFTASGEVYSATFEALLLGHEDWIYSTRWNRSPDSLQLLSASADNSLTIWEPDQSSGVWVSVTRLGEISAQKGSTTATGSTGGFWTGLFSPDGNTVVCLGRTGSWRVWDYVPSEGRWNPSIGVSGHTSSITGLTWSPDGGYLLTTSSDQTTRLHTKWEQPSPTKPTWHEFARPQIHGYDLNCISSLTPTTFISGADEKLLRVFTLPKAVASLLNTLSNLSFPTASQNGTEMSDAANMPVLGLSNKAISAIDDDAEVAQPAPHSYDRDNDAIDPASIIRTSTLALPHPPLEDHLSRNTLFPEIEKLYGHGYEISCLATSHDGRLVATACKASSIDHAVIRLFETKKWTEIKPPLQAHSLTVTRLRFSADDRFLLSVGRDRQWVVWERVGDEERCEYVLKVKEPKGHARMILDCAWMAYTSVATGAVSEKRFFATAGRDKSVKIWRLRGDVEGAQEGKVEAVLTISEEGPVTAVDFVDGFTGEGERLTYLAVGTESGRITVYELAVGGAEYEVRINRKGVVNQRLSPSKAITQLSWRPSQGNDSTTVTDARELAVASEDGSLRLFTLGGILSAST